MSQPSYRESMLSEITRVAIYSYIAVTSAAVLIAIWKQVDAKLIVLYTAPLAAIVTPILSSYLAVRQVQKSGGSNGDSGP